MLETVLGAVIGVKKKYRITPASVVIFDINFFVILSILL